GTIEVGYQFDDVDNETVPGLNESQDFPAQTATTTAPTSVAIEGISCSLKCFRLAAYRIGPPAPAVIAEAVGHNHPHIAEGKV
ncbi:hypothetical protein, partial [Klebsiella pneumoniae]|uniref:hypothetical protein n=1 Tax=Klebsiella pneumoniae TaxID=573 RepID=UPI0022EA8C72